MCLHVCVVVLVFDCGVVLSQQAATDLLTSTSGEKRGAGLAAGGGCAQARVFVCEERGDACHSVPHIIPLFASRN